MEGVIYIFAGLVALAVLFAQLRLFSMDETLKSILAELRAQRQAGGARPAGAPEEHGREANWPGKAPASGPALGGLPQESGAWGSAVTVAVVAAILFGIGLVGWAVVGDHEKRGEANEASAVGALRTLNVVLVQYQVTYGGTFPLELRHLGPTPAGQKYHREAADLIDNVLASGEKSGYLFTYTPKRGARRVEEYEITASPKERDAAARHFFTDQSGVIRYNRGGPADALSSPIGMP